MSKVTTISATQMHRQRGALLKRCGKNNEHFIIEKDGIPLAALIPIEYYKSLTTQVRVVLSNPD